MQIPTRYRRDVPVPVAAILALMLGGGPCLVLRYRYVPAGQHITDTPTILGAFLGLLYALVVAILSMRILRSTDARVWFTILMILGGVFSGPTLVYAVNMGFDQSPSKHYTARVLEFHPPGKHQASITITHWEPDLPPLTIPGSQIPGTELPLVIHQGYLGFPWIEWPADAITNQR